MLRKEDFAMIKALHERGVYHKDIARQLGVHPKTVSRALKRQGAPSGQRAPRGAKLDPFKPLVDRLLADGVWNAVVVLREIQAAGYTGQLTVLRQYIQPKRVLRASRATVRFETPPGRQLQNDWGETRVEIGGALTKVYFSVNLLSYSRRFHFWCTESCDAEHTYEGLVRSFEYFGGVPTEVLVDNQKATVFVHPPSGPVHFNPRFVDLAGHYGFLPRACKPYRARTKGKDERMVGYIKQHFFVRYRRFESWAHLNQLAEAWLAAEADQRVQSTVKEVVSQRFAREAPQLQPLPAGRYDTAYHELRQVGWDGYIDVRGNRYSVPGELVGQTVTVRIGLDDTLRVYHGEQVQAYHDLRAAEHGWASVPEHHRRLWEDALQVERRSLAVYQEVAAWS
jgi:transposase